MPSNGGVFKHNLNDCVTPPPSDEDKLISEIEFSDANFANCVSSLAASNGWTKTIEMAVLYCSNKGIRNVSGLEHFTKLTYIDLSRNYLTELPHLAGFDVLTELRLTMNSINDVSSLSDLPIIEDLSLFRNNVSDIMPLANLTSLTALHMSENQITDISAISGLTNLTNVTFGSNQVNDLSPVASLTKLESLGAYDNQVSDISVLGNLSLLKNAYLADNQITDLSIFNHPATDNIARLFLERNGIADVTPLFKYSEINDLALQGNPDIPCVDIDYIKSMIGNDLRHDGACVQ